MHLTPRSQTTRYTDKVLTQRVGQRMEQNLEAKTGKTLAQWKVVLAEQAFTKHGECMSFLKKEQGLTHGFANFITLKFREADAGSADAEDLVENQYKGKESLRPIYEKLLVEIKAIGDDIVIAPKKSAVSCKVKRQFALIQPSTKTRIDLGLKFNEKPPQGRLETSGPFGTMCTHRVQLTDISHIDDELMTWIVEAYKEAK